MNIPHIPNSFSNVKSACDEKLSQLYPSGIPKPIQIRLETELNFLKASKLQDDFEIFRLLSEAAKKSSTLISTRGTIAGSFIFYLLGNNCFNPLPVHYYCPECGYYEQVQTHLFGIDLPPKHCPNCERLLIADGFNLSPESVWGIDGNKTLSFSYNVNTEFPPYAYRVISALYPNNSVVPWGMFEMEPFIQPASDNQITGVGLVGYSVLPTNTTIHDYPDLISYLDNGDLCVTGGGWELEKNNIKPIHLYQLEHLDYLLALQRSTGIYANEITTKALRDITWSNILSTTVLNSTASLCFHELKPKSYRDMVAFDSVSHSTFSWQNLEEMDFQKLNQMISSASFKKYPCFTRDDFFDYLIDENIDRKLAFEVSERIRKGHANPKRHKDDFYTLPIPEDIKNVARNYCYLLPRAHCVEYILIYARLAYYAKIDSRAFSKTVFKKNSVSH